MSVQFNTKSPTIKRILQESKEMSRNPDPSLSAAPLEDNLFEWHFTFAGPPSSPYESGIYHGRIILPPSYPLRPPMFRFMTPSGRFEVNREICLSISGHHEETWQPAWGIRTALCAIRAFMESEAKGQVGGLDASESARRRLANESRSWKCSRCGDRTMEGIIQDCKQQWESAKAKGTVTEKAEQIPDELRLAYKDELSPSSSQSNREAEGPSSGRRSETQKSATRATTPIRESVTPATPTSTTRGTFATVPVSAGTQRAGGTTILVSNDGTPAWIDKAIVGLVVALLVMLIRRAV